MTMPVDLVLVRHGDSEGNAANRWSRQGNDKAFTKEFLARHSSRWRLTDRGVGQIKMTGEWIRKNLSLPFDRYYTSEYARAMETAMLLDLPGATWYVEFYLRERDYGVLDVMTQKDRRKNHRDYLEKRKSNPLFSIPPNGESMATLCLRIDRVLNTLHRECSDKRVIIVCHGEVIEAFRIRLERLSEASYKELIDSINLADRIYNGQIFHYTRRNPKTNQLALHANWTRSIRPGDDSFSEEWREIRRPKYSNEDLKQIISKMPRTVNDE